MGHARTKRGPETRPKHDARRTPSSRRTHRYWARRPAQQNSPRSLQGALSQRQNRIIGQNRVALSLRQARFQKSSLLAARQEERGAESGLNQTVAGKALLSTMEAWAAILPETVPQPQSTEWCKPYTGSYGYLFSGAGGGFLMVVSTRILG